MPARSKTQQLRGQNAHKMVATMRRKDDEATDKVISSMIPPVEDEGRLYVAGKLEVGPSERRDRRPQSLVVRWHGITDQLTEIRMMNDDTVGTMAVDDRKAAGLATPLTLVWRRRMTRALTATAGRRRPL